MWLFMLNLACITADDIDARLDADADGYQVGDDCDDTNPAVNPAAVERCNGIDDDCDGVIDGPNSQDATTVYQDEDGDGFGAAAVQDCSGAAHTSASSDDCDDGDPAINPSATETCGDGVDDDCATSPECRLLGDFPAGFGGWASLRPPTAPAAIASGDFNGDGLADLATLDADGTLRVYWTAATGGALEWTSETSQLPTARTVQLISGDIDGDGFEDLVIEQHEGGVTSTLRWGDPVDAISPNSAIQVFTSVTDNQPLGTVAVVRRPMDSRPALTIAAQQGEGNALFTLTPNRGDADVDTAQAVAQHVLGDRAWRPRPACDVLATGTCGLLLLNPESSGGPPVRYVPWLDDANQSLEGAGFDWTAGGRPLVPSGVAQQADVDGDGSQDIALLLSDPSRIEGTRTVLVRSPRPPADLNLLALPGFVTSPAVASLHAVALPDLDHDGLADFVSLGESGGSFVLYVSYGPGPSEQVGPEQVDLKLTLGTAASANAVAHLTTADVNGDGHIDLIATVATSPPYIWVITGYAD